MSRADDLPVVRTLAELADLVERHHGLYVRWSRGPEADLADASSTDDLTGVRMSGLSANPLDVEDWWDDRPVAVWVARRLYDYSHLPHEKGPGVYPWVLRGREASRGPDNEPLVADVRPMCRLDDRTIDEARDAVDRQDTSWGPLRRPGR
ncbi:DUF6098 family protein [Streptomyces sp. NBC_01352]|uniref:Uncharacterized protein n=1 Tax=Streptomyces plumbiresistens TaxID=511811 RepID=A0ABP7RKG1_9ACTN|nr:MULTISPECIES: DUF6098 family protein [unclassified Streptomyces]MCX4703491.1 DUF6098 family protein [Streptomyces sp. NBC_01373]